MTSTRTSSSLGPVGLLARHFRTNALLAVTATVGGLVILGLTAAGAGVYDAVAEKDGISALDQPALNQVIAWRTPLANQLFTVFTHLCAPRTAWCLPSASPQLTRAALPAGRPARHEMPNSSLIVSSLDTTAPGGDSAAAHGGWRDRGRWRRPSPWQSPGAFSRSDRGKGSPPWSCSWPPACCCCALRLGSSTTPV